MAIFDELRFAQAFAKAKEAQNYHTKITLLYPDGVTAVWQVMWWA
jgi:hypothetical protein